jgi:hypothetical protein
MISYIIKLLCAYMFSLNLPFHLILVVVKDYTVLTSVYDYVFLGLIGLSRAES